MHSQQEIRKNMSLTGMMFSLGCLAIEINKAHDREPFGLLTDDRINAAFTEVVCVDVGMLRGLHLSSKMLVPQLLAGVITLCVQLQPDFVPIIGSQSMMGYRGQPVHKDLVEALGLFAARVEDGTYSLGSGVLDVHQRMYVDLWTLMFPMDDEFRKIVTELYGPAHTNTCVNGTDLVMLVGSLGFEGMLEAYALGIIEKEALSVSMSYSINTGMRHPYTDGSENLRLIAAGWAVPMMDMEQGMQPREIDRLPQVRMLLCQHFGESYYLENADYLHSLVIDALSSYTGLSRFTPEELLVCSEEMENAAQQLAKELGHVLTDRFGHRVMGCGNDRMFMHLRASLGLYNRLNNQPKTGWYAQKVYMLLEVQELIHCMVLDRLPLGEADMPRVTAHQCGVDK